MSDHIDIPANEHGVVRVFSLSMPAERARFLREEGAMAQVLGLDALDMDNVEIFPLSDLDDLGLAHYLTEGLGVPTNQIAPQRERLRALTGWVMIIRSRAFQDRATRLTLPDEVVPIASFYEPSTDWHSPGTIATPSARAPDRPAHPDTHAAPAPKHRTGAYVLIGFIAALLLVALVLALL